MANPQFGPVGDKIPKGATPTVLKGQAGPVLGQQQIPSHKEGQGPGGNAGIPIPQRTAQLSPAQTPRGAQQIPLAGVPAQADQQGPAPFVAAKPRMAGAAPPEAQESYTVRIEAVGLDGKRFRAEFDALFPRGARITHLGVVE